MAFYKSRYEVVEGKIRDLQEERKSLIDLVMEARQNENAILVAYLASLKLVLWTSRKYTTSFIFIYCSLLKRTVSLWWQILREKSQESFFL